MIFVKGCFLARSRERSRALKCPRCFVSQAHCFCSEIVEFKTETKVTFIMHKDERWLTSNTVHLATLSIPNSEVILRGLENDPIESHLTLDENYTQLYLFPTGDAQELTPEFVATLKKPVQLIIPDGTWRQASKMHKREAILKDIPKVVIKPDAPSGYTLRNQNHENNLCSFEAMSYALAALEKNSPSIKEGLFKLFKIMNDSFARARGQRLN